ncbi:MAG: hypothetical protein NTU41_01285, partial [Chloroflexi bacterium]|nr:hypothetical protein [Chloroflexota bacterium]
AKAFLGYCPLWDKYQLRKRIERLYELRCGLVHEGRRKDIGTSDLIFSDELVRNLLRSMFDNRRHISSKASIIEFAERETAKAKLGLKPRSPSWRYLYGQTAYTDEDYRMHWRL